jgi:hypothetical protein
MDLEYSEISPKLQQLTFCSKSWCLYIVGLYISGLFGIKKANISHGTGCCRVPDEPKKRIWSIEEVSVPDHEALNDLGLSFHESVSELRRGANDGFVYEDDESEDGGGKTGYRKDWDKVEFCAVRITRRNGWIGSAQ